jgi:hypothetical protein
MRWGTATRRTMKPGLAALALAVSSALAAACTASGPHSAGTAAATASVAGAAVSAAAAPGRGAGKIARVTLSPTQPAGPSLLAAAAGVIRQRAAVLMLRHASVTVSDGTIVLTGPEPSQSQLASLVAAGTLELRPVLLSAPYAGPARLGGPHGDARLVDAAAMRLFRMLECRPGGSAGAADDGWKAAVGYSPVSAPWAEPGSQTVSCDTSGTRYVLGSTVVAGPQVTSAAAARSSAAGQWVVYLTLDAAAAKAFGVLTTRQYAAYNQGAEAGNADDAVLDSIAIVFNGDVLAAPQTLGALTAGTFEISGTPPAGFTEAAAAGLAAALATGPLPVGLRVADIAPTVSTTAGQSGSGD